MNTPVFTSLAACPIDKSQIQFLNSLWVESAEEAISLFWALENTPKNVTLERVKTEAYSILSSYISSDRMKVLQSPVSSRPLGLMVDEKDRAELLARQSALKSGRAACAFEGSLPNTIRLTNQMPPIKDQGIRGTCVAFASLALREFIGKGKVSFSEQFFYWACKDLDQDQMPGTRLTTAMSTFDSHGVCLASDWSYVPYAVEGNEGQHPAPEIAILTAKNYRMQTRHVMASLIQNYKHVLAGKDGTGGMPIVVGTEVFDSWMRSYETQRTGKITMPFPEEKAVGGHAWCIVGYVDKAGVPGGGYFIVRNSWGVSWAPESPEQRGYAMMPYAYVEQYSHDAFTGVTEEEIATKDAQNVFNQEESRWKPYLRELKEEGRDMEKRKWPKGVKVVFHPDEPSVFMLDDANGLNRAKFEANGYAWTDQQTNKNRESVAKKLGEEWLPPKEMWPDSFCKQQDQLLAAQSHFRDAIKQNLYDIISKEKTGEVKVGDETFFPDHNLPWYATFIPWQVQIHTLVEETDLSKQLVAAVIRCAGAPTDIKLPEVWEHLLLEVNALRIYRLSSLPSDIRVVAAFVSPLDLSHGSPPAFRVPTTKMIEEIRGIVTAWAKTAPGRKPVYTFFSLSSGMPWPVDQKGVEAGSEGLQFSSRTAASEPWTIIPQPCLSTKPSFRNFMERMQPITWRQRVEFVRNEVNRLINIAEPTISVPQVADKMVYRKTTVKRAFLQIQKDSPDIYSVYKVENGKDKGELAIKEFKNGGKPSLTDASFRKGFFRRHLLLLSSAAVAVAFSRLPFFIKQEMNGMTGFASAMFICYLTSLIQKQINRRASEEKE